MAKLAYDVGDKETAVSLGKRILSLSANDADVLSMVGWLEYGAGQLDCASLSSFSFDFRVHWSLSAVLLLVLLSLRVEYEFILCFINISCSCFIVHAAGGCE